MATASIAHPGNANAATAQSGSSNCTGVQFTAAVMRKAHEVFRTKIAEEVAARTRSGLRTAYHWKAGEREMQIEDFLALLEGEEALQFLEVFWAFVPQVTRERWIKQEVLNRRIRERERKLARDAAEIDQLKFELRKR